MYRKPNVRLTRILNHPVKGSSYYVYMSGICEFAKRPQFYSGGFPQQKRFE